MLAQKQIGVSKMTIVEEIDKISGRPHRSRNIQDAIDYLSGAVGGSQNISNAVHRYSPESAPTGSIDISTNGNHDVTAYATAVVAVPQPEGNLDINTSSATFDTPIDISQYATITLKSGE